MNNAHRIDTVSKILRIPVVFLKNMTQMTVALHTADFSANSRVQAAIL